MRAFTSAVCAISQMDLYISTEAVIRQSGQFAVGQEFKMCLDLFKIVSMLQHQLRQRQVIIKVSLILSGIKYKFLLLLLSPTSNSQLDAWRDPWKEVGSRASKGHSWTTVSLQENKGLLICSERLHYMLGSGLVKDSGINRSLNQNHFLVQQSVIVPDT